MAQKDLRVATVATTTSYQKFSSLLVDAFGSARVFTDGAFRAAPDAANPVVICITDKAAPADGASQTLAAGEYLPFSRVNLLQVWVKSTGGASAVGFQGDIE